MNEPSKSSPAVRYVLVILAAEALMVLISFAMAGFSVREMGLPLVGVGVVALLYGLWRLGGSEPKGTGVGAVKAMRGQAGGNPLANYTNRQEYKLSKKLEDARPVDENPEQDVEWADERELAASRSETDRLVAVCLTVAGLLAIVLSWLLGRFFS